MGTKTIGINWKDIDKFTPSNNKKYGFDTPFVSCIVWVANPISIRFGTIDVLRWDVKNKCWLKSDMVKWIHSNPHLKITHFSDDYNLPK